MPGGESYFGLRLKLRAPGPKRTIPPNLVQNGYLVEENEHENRLTYEHMNRRGGMDMMTLKGFFVHFCAVAYMKINVLKTRHVRSLPTLNRFKPDWEG